MDHRVARMHALVYVAGDVQRMQRAYASSLREAVAD